MPESSVYKLGKAAGRLTKAWLEVIVEFSKGFQEEAGDFESALKNAFPSTQQEPPEDS